jgi:hypothetical protein
MLWRNLKELWGWWAFFFSVARARPSRAQLMTPHQWKRARERATAAFLRTRDAARWCPTCKAMVMPTMAPPDGWPMCLQCRTLLDVPSSPIAPSAPRATAVLARPQTPPRSTAARTTECMHFAILGSSGRDGFTCADCGVRMDSDGLGHYRAVAS